MKDTTPENSSPDSGSRGFQAPHPGSKEMPRWQTGELVKAPVFTTRNWFGLLGPGLLLGGGAIGGGEWLMGPAVTAKYGGALMWLATLSIMSQVLYNIEISRYALYTGEPIFTGKFRTLPGPRFWLIAYIFLDFGAVFPYLAANAATPLAAVLLGGVLPDPLNNDAHWWLLKILGYLIFLAALIPLLIGGKIYNSLRAVMTFKIVVVLGFLSILGIFHSSLSTWFEIFSGFLKFGSVPVGGNRDREHLRLPAWTRAHCPRSISAPSPSWRHSPPSPAAGGSPMLPSATTRGIRVGEWGVTSEPSPASSEGTT